MNRQVKVAHIISNLDFGGAEGMLKRLLLSDVSYKVDCVVISLTNLGAIGEELLSLGYTVYHLNLNAIKRMPVNIFVLIKILKQFKPDIVQTWMYHADLIGGVIARTLGFKNVIWGIRRSNVRTNKRMTNFFVKICSFLSYFIPRQIVCVAESAKKSHIAYGYDEKIFFTIPNGYNCDDFDRYSYDKLQVRNKLGLPQISLLIGCVGRYHVDKGQYNLIKAAKLMNLKGDIKFVLIGRGCDEHNKELLNIIESSGLSSVFMLTGQKENIREYLAVLDIFCMPSDTEGFPNALAEAMLMELPSVATQVGDTEMLVAEHAMLVPPNNPRALAKGLTTMIEMPSDKRNALGKAASAHVRSKYSITAMKQLYTDLYNHILEFK